MRTVNTLFGLCKSHVFKYGCVMGAVLENSFMFTQARTQAYSMPSPNKQTQGNTNITWCQKHLLKKCGHGKCSQASGLKSGSGGHCALPRALQRRIKANAEFLEDSIE